MHTLTQNRQSSYTQFVWIKFSLFSFLHFSAFIRRNVEMATTISETLSSVLSTSPPATTSMERGNGTTSGFENPFEYMPLDSNFAWLLCALMCVFVWMIYGSCFHSRLVGFIIGSILNQYLKRNGFGELSIGRLKNHVTIFWIWRMSVLRRFVENRCCFWSSSFSKCQVHHRRLCSYHFRWVYLVPLLDAVQNQAALRWGPKFGFSGLSGLSWVYIIWLYFRLQTRFT